MADRGVDTQAVAQSPLERFLHDRRRRRVRRPLALSADVAPAAKCDGAVRPLLPVVVAPARVDGPRERNLRGRLGGEHLEPRRAHACAQLRQQPLQRAVHGDDDVFRAHATALGAHGRLTEPGDRRALEQLRTIGDCIRRQHAAPRERLKRAIAMNDETHALGPLMTLGGKRVSSHRVELTFAVGAFLGGLGDAQRAAALHQRRCLRFDPVELRQRQPIERVRRGAAMASDGVVIEVREPGEEESAIPPGGSAGHPRCLHARDTSAEPQELADAGEAGSTESHDADIHVEVGFEPRERG